MRKTNQSPLARHYNQEIETLRLTEVEGTDKEEYTSKLGEVPCMIQPLDDSFDEGLEGHLGRNHLMICEILDIEINDLVFHNGKKYKVVGKEDFSVIDDRLTHLELIIREFIND